MQAVATPFYLDWSFWAVIVAFLAILLSQIPPILTLLKRAKLDLDIHSKLSITHKLGNPNLQLHLILNNIGGRRVKVKDINVSISRDNAHVVDFPAQTFLQNQNDINTVLFTIFALDPKQEWAHFTNFLNYFNRENEKEYQQIEGDLLSDLRANNKSIEGKASTENKDIYEHPDNLVQPVYQFFNKHFCWKAGEYTININVVTDSESANIAKKYRFTIFESHTETLTSIKDHFKYGGGTYWNTKNQTSVVLELTEA